MPLNQGGQLIGRAQQGPGDEHNAGNAANGAPHGPQGRQGKAHGPSGSRRRWHPPTASMHSAAGFKKASDHKGNVQVAQLARQARHSEAPAAWATAAARRTTKERQNGGQALPEGKSQTGS